MARDYKYRAQKSSHHAGRHGKITRNNPNMLPRVLLVACLVIGFAAFLIFVHNLVTDQPDGEASPANQTVTQALSATPAPAESNKADLEVATEQEQPAPEAEQIQAEEPRYDFYTILPQAETVIPDYEIQSRVREELVGKSKATKYMMQAGSFRNAADAERHKARLASLGIESQIEKAKVGNAIWHRVKVGPYNTPSSVSTIKDLLEKNGIGVIVTEQGK